MNDSVRTFMLEQSLDQLQKSVDWACQEIDRLRKENAELKAKLTELVFAYLNSEIIGLQVCKALDIKPGSIKALIGGYLIKLARRRMLKVVDPKPKP